MRFLVFLALTGISCLTISGQVQDITNSSFDQFVYEIKRDNKLNPGSEGSGFIYEDFVQASVNNSSKLKMVRFNLVDDKIEVRVNEEEVLQLLKNEKFEVRIMNGSNRIFRTFSFCKKKSKCKPRNSFFEELYLSDDFSIYFKEKVTYYRAKTNLTGYDEREPAKFVPAKGKYYITNFISRTGELFEIPDNEEKFLEMFDEKHVEAMSSFITSNNFDIENSADLVIVFTNYFQMISEKK